ncbi:MAG: hypothetical protein H7301_06180 [Cryobacterium sp.]|nr:hypothetical protein [Oligoflexia bacterium]
MKNALTLRSDARVILENGREESEFLLLQGRPIGEPVAQQRPFVMNTTSELQVAFAEYRRTLFGGWPWPKDDPTFPASQKRFARYADGKSDQPREGAYSPFENYFTTSGAGQPGQGAAIAFV